MTYHGRSSWRCAAALASLSLLTLGACEDADEPAEDAVDSVEDAADDAADSVDDAVDDTGDAIDDATDDGG